jgi:4-coumarate--CoA ligase
LIVPSNISVWDWLFTSPATSETFQCPKQGAKGFTNTVNQARLTYHDIREHSIHLATALRNFYALKEGEVVSICAPNSIWYPVAMFGAMRLGAIAALSSPGYTVDEMIHAFKTVGCRFVFASESSLDVVRKAAAMVGIDIRNIFIVDGNVDGFKSVSELVDLGKQFGNDAQVMPFLLPKGKDNSQVCALLCFSSGTTGLPKAVS